MKVHGMFTPERAHTDALTHAIHPDMLALDVQGQSHSFKFNCSLKLAKHAQQSLQKCNFNSWMATSQDLNAAKPKLRTHNSSSKLTLTESINALTTLDHWDVKTALAIF